MPKLIPKTVKPAKTVKQKPLIERVADAADREAIYATDLIRFPEMLAKHRITEHVSHTTALAADRYNTEQLDNLKRRYMKKEISPYADSTY